MAEKELKEELKRFYDEVLGAFYWVLDHSKNGYLTREQVLKTNKTKLEMNNKGKTTPLVSYIYILSNYKLLSPAFIYASMLKVMELFNADVFDKNLMLEVEDNREDLYKAFFCDAIVKEYKSMNDKGTQNEQ